MEKWLGEEEIQGWGQVGRVWRQVQEALKVAFPRPTLMVH